MMLGAQSLTRNRDIMCIELFRLRLFVGYYRDFTDVVALFFPFFFILLGTEAFNNDMQVHEG